MELRVHVPSALIGAASLGLVLLATGAQHVLKDPSPKTLKLPVQAEQTLRVKGIPAPDQMTRVVEGAPFVVPQGKVFVATGTAMNKEVQPGRAQVYFDGEPVYYRQWWNVVSGTGVLGTEAGIPPGLVAPADTVVSVEANLGGPFKASLLGYLADA